MAEDTTEMQIMDTSSDPITGTPEQGMQETGMPSPTMQRDEMPRFETLGQERQTEILNMFPEMEKQALLSLMQTGMSFEDAMEEINRMFQNPPPQLRQDEMDMLREIKNMPFSTDEDIKMNMLGGPMSDKDAQVLRDAKDPQTGMPIRKFDFMNKSGALGAFGGEMPMGKPTENVQEMMRRRNKRRNM